MPTIFFIFLRQYGLKNLPAQAKLIKSPYHNKKKGVCVEVELLKQKIKINLGFNDIEDKEVYRITSICNPSYYMR